MPSLPFLEIGARLYRAAVAELGRSPEEMSPNLTWLVGKRLKDAAKQDYTWSFTFFDGGWIGTESGWRLVTADGIAVTAEDHGHVFGLPSPVDAGARVQLAVEGKKIRAVRIADRTSDLILEFEEGVSLEFLNLSCGYESWHTQHDSEEVICQGGGQLVTLSKKKGDPVGTDNSGAAPRRV